MALAESLQFTSAASWHKKDDPLVLGEIFSASTSIAIWQRPQNTAIAQYFSDTFTALGAGVRTVFNMSSLKAGLDEVLPEHPHKATAISDIYTLSDMLTCLFDCEDVGLRLVPLNKAMCPRFHVDNIPARLVTTYLGQGTEWLANERTFDDASWVSADKVEKTRFGKYFDAADIQQLKHFDVAILKGSAFSDEHPLAAIHRSCQVAEDEQRVLLTLDPM